MAAEEIGRCRGRCEEPTTSLHSTRIVRLRSSSSRERRGYGSEEQILAPPPPLSVSEVRKEDFFLMGANGGGNTKREVTPGFVVQRRTDFPISCHLVVERARTRSCQFLSPPGLPLEKRPIQPFLPSLAKGCFENRAGHNADYLQPSKLPFFISTRPS
jgi:hypothetical protein